MKKLECLKSSSRPVRRKREREKRKRINLEETEKIWNREEMRDAVEIEIEDDSRDTVVVVVVVVEVVVSFRGVDGLTRENDSGIYRTIDDVKCTLIVLIMYIHGM